MAVKAPGLPIAVAHVFQRHFVAISSITVLAAVAGFTLDRLVGGNPAVIAGTIQAFTVVAYVCWGLIFLLFKRYGPKASAVLDLWGVTIIRLLLFVLLSVITLFAAVFLGLRVLSYAS
jgi:hypothetical protein